MQQDTARLFTNINNTWNVLQLNGHVSSNNNITGVDHEYYKVPPVASEDGFEVIVDTLIFEEGSH